MKQFEYKAKHERYINNKIDNMNSEQLLIKVIDNWIAVNKNGKKLSLFRRQYDNECFIELCKRYRVNMSQLKEQFIQVAEQRLNGNPLTLKFY